MGLCSLFGRELSRCRFIGVLRACGEPAPIPDREILRLMKSRG